MEAAMVYKQLCTVSAVICTSCNAARLYHWHGYHWTTESSGQTSKPPGMSQPSVPQVELDGFRWLASNFVVGHAAVQRAREGLMLLQWARAVWYVNQGAEVQH
eukprot:1135654-Rhodomonas_salina.1